MAVFPFRLTGSDTSYHALREGMVDFLEVKFSGAGGARVVPARTALAAWHRTLRAQGQDLTPEEAGAEEDPPPQAVVSKAAAHSDTTDFRFETRM